MLSVPAQVGVEAPLRRRSAQAWLILWGKRLWALGLCGCPVLALPHPALWAWAGVGPHWLQGN